METFNKLYTAQKMRYIAVAHAYLQDRELSEDIVSESFIEYLENRDKMDIRTMPEAYILGIVRNKSLMALRARMSREKVRDKIKEALDEAAAEELENESLIRNLFSRDVMEIFRKELERMPELTAQIFTDNRIYGMTYSEIAKARDVSVHKVAREISKALAILRKSLKDYLPIVLAVIYVRLQ